MIIKLSSSTDCFCGLLWGDFCKSEVSSLCPSLHQVNPHPLAEKKGRSSFWIVFYEWLKRRLLWFSLILELRWPFVQVPEVFRGDANETFNWDDDVIQNKCFGPEDRLVYQTPPSSRQTCLLLQFFPLCSFLLLYAGLANSFPSSFELPWKHVKISHSSGMS